MTTKIVKGTNAQILNKVRTLASQAYRDRIPVATDNNLHKTMAALDQYSVLWNEFADVLIQRIGLTVYNTNSFENKLKPLKTGAMSYGGIIQEIGANLLEAEAYDPNATDVFSAPKPDVVVNYHSINRRDVYPMRLNHELLEEAMLSEGQLQAYINSMLALPQQSDEWDEYLIMRNLLGMYNHQDGFANFQVPDLSTSTDPEADGKKITKMVREMYLTTKDFYSKAYNAAGMDATSKELILLGTPKVFASIDVDVLAVAYNMDRANFLADRTIILDDFGPQMEGTQVMLVDRDIYKAVDTKIKTTNIYNPKADEWVYYLHHQGIYSLSRMRNAMRFSTDTTNVGPVATRTVTSVAAALATPVTDNKVVEAGAQIELVPTVTYSDSTTDGRAYWILTGSTEDSPVVDGDTKANVILPDTGTYVDRMNVLHINDKSTYTTITATAIADADNTKIANIVLAAK